MNAGSQINAKHSKKTPKQNVEVSRLKCSLMISMSLTVMLCP